MGDDPFGAGTPDIWDKDYRDIFKRADEKKREDDRRDLQNEIAGRITGRIRRFLPKGAGSADSIGDKNDKDALTALQLLLLENAEFAALYADTWDLLEQAEKETAEEIARAEKDFEALMDRAVRLPDGRAVFLDDDGNAVTKDGKPIDPALAAGIDWPEDALTFREYISARQYLDDLRGYQVETLGRIRDRMENQRDPVTENELREIQDDIRTQKPEVPRVTQQLTTKIEDTELTNDANTMQVLDF